MNKHFTIKLTRGAKHLIFLFIFILFLTRIEAQINVSPFQMTTSARSHENITLNNTQFNLDVSLYRTYNGSSNNMQDIDKGKTHSSLLRKLNHAYYHGNGGDMSSTPNPREVSNEIFSQSESIPNEEGFSSLVFTFLQFIDHDITIVEGTGDDAAAIPVPLGDPLFDPFFTGNQVISFNRSDYVENTGTDEANPRQHENLLTAWLDGSGVYGSDEDRADWLRSGINGKLKSSSSIHGDLLPYNTLTGEIDGEINLSAPAMAGDKDMAGNPQKVFVTGDLRANEQVGLTAFHVLFMREHNRICDELVAEGQFDDETNYQLARKMVGGQIASILYNELLPILGINLPDYSYQSDKTPDIFTEFASAAYRLGHTMVTDEILLLDENYMAPNGAPESLELKDAFFNPTIFVEYGPDVFLRGLSAQTQEELDAKIVDAIRNFLFGPPGSGGLDLAALNIQRGRDHGIPHYNAARENYGLSQITNFNQITSDIDVENSLKAVYPSVDDIDLWVGALAEDKLAGKSMGETLHHILMEQFQNIRDADRFYYLNDPLLTPAQKSIIHETRLEDILNRNTTVGNLSNVFFTNSLCNNAGIDTDNDEICDNTWNIQLSQSNLNCNANQVCYTVELQGNFNSWTLGDQNYRFFFDGDLMTATSVSSLLPTDFYSSVNIDQNIKITGQGQEAASPLDDIDSNLGFLDFSIVETDKENPSAAAQVLAGSYIPTAEICFDVVPEAITETTCLSLYHSRPSTAGNITNQYTVFSENNIPGSTVATSGVTYTDLTETSGTEACLNLSCDACASAGGDTDNDGICNDDDCEPNNPNMPTTPGMGCDDNDNTTINDVILADGCTCAGTTMNDWNIQLVQSGLDCQGQEVCYDLQLQSASATSWALGDQNYRLFFDGDLMTVTSVTSLLSSSLYFPAEIEMNQKYSNQNQEVDSPLDNIDDNLGFLDFNIVEIDKSNPNVAVQLSTTTFTSIAQICVDVAPAVIEDVNGGTCLSFIHSRPSTAGAFTNQYTVITENDAPNSTAMTIGEDYNDLNSADGDNACLGIVCDPCATAGGDTDNDGVCDNDDCSPTNPNLPAVVGSSCNDNDATTSNDVILADGCTCAGATIFDCPTLSANIGDACNDNDATTTNDTVQSDCSCAGTIVFDCPTLSANIGDACNDNDTTTTNDTVQSDCTCAGTNVFDCPTLSANIGDACNDNDVTTTNDTVQSDCSCAGTIVFDCPTLSANIGDACNDNDATTTNDTVQSDCTCVGTPSNTSDCADISVTASSGTITVSGLDGAPISSVQVFNSAWSTEFSCFADCDSPSQAISVAEGVYYVYVKYFNAGYGFICQEVQTVTVTGGATPCDNAGGDSDNDGVCNDDDCQPTNPNIPATPGTTCDDNNASTINDVILSDGCSCEGIIISACANAGGDSDNDGICNDNDCQPFNPSIPATPGTTCNDNDASTINDAIQTDGCSCAGTPVITGDCANITVTGTDSGISIGGLNGAPITSVQIFNANTWNTEFNCFADCDSPTQNVALPSGTYYAYVKYYDATYKLICEVNETVTVTGGSTCNNTTAGGQIGGTQTVCPNVAASTLTSISSPTGGSGDIEYLWLSSTTGCPSGLTQEIAGATDATYSPGILTQTTYFIRCSRRVGCTSWSGESNCIVVTIEYNTSCDPTDICDNVTSGGQIGSSQTICPNTNTATITNIIAPSGGTGNLEYIWLSSTLSCPSSNQIIPGATSASYSPGVLTESTFFRRCARRAGCTTYIGESNCILITVENSADCGGNNTGVDLELAISGDGAAVIPYSNFTVTVSISNTGTETANSVVVNIPQPANVVFQGGNGFSSTQGQYDLFSTFNWNVGTLNTGQTESLTLNYYSLQGTDYTVYGQVQSSSTNDIDSTPGNGTAPTPNEDDEAVYVTGGGNTSCTLNLTANVANVTCDDNGTANDDTDDTFTFDLTVAGGNPWGWTGGGENGTYNISHNFGPFPINEGNVNFTITDNDNNTCNVNINVPAPTTCSNDSTGGSNNSDCSNINVSNTNTDITINGLDSAPLTATWVFDSNWNTILECSYQCNSTETISVSAGVYHVIVKKMNLDWTVICQVEETITINTLMNNDGERIRQEGANADLRSTQISTGSDDLGFKVYPNPTFDYFNVQLNTISTEPIGITLLDKFGRVIFKESINISHMLDYRLDMSDKSAGVYFLNIQMPDGSFMTERVVFVK